MGQERKQRGQLEYRRDSPGDGGWGIVMREKWSGSKCVLKVAPIGFADGWNVGHEEEAKVRGFLFKHLEGSSCNC